ncbi:MAG: YbaN family protein [Lachnospiraceae bacterium]
MKYIYLTLGFVFCGLGLIGVFLPVLPTVPFLLLTSFCFSRGSKRFNDWFTNTRLYKTHLEYYEKEYSMKLVTKIRIMFFASSMLIISFVLLENIFVKTFIVIIALVMHYYFIFKIKTVEKLQ